MILNCFVSAANVANVKGAKVALAPVLEIWLELKLFLQIALTEVH